MGRRSGFLTFLAALIPGVGYMYLGLVKKGVQTLALFLLIEPVLRIIGLGFLVAIIRIPFGCYTFFDTFNLASKIDRGETVTDSDFIFKSYENNGTGIDWHRISRNTWMLIAWLFIGAGTLAIMNTALKNLEVYGLIKSFISVYFFPVILVLAGVYLLFRNNRRY